MSKKIKVWVVTKTEYDGDTDIWGIYSSFEKGKQALLDMFKEYRIDCEEYINDSFTYGRWDTGEDVYRLNWETLILDDDVEEITEEDEEDD